jgi:DNA (cytosine-5)-methyltransferase 1
VNYLCVCSGISAPTAAWQSLGWRAAAFAETDRFASAVLAHRYPGVPNLGDFTAITERDVGAIDLLVGGTPCQDFSIAGQRQGLDGARGNLAIEFCRLARRLRPRWILWENVPGVHSSWSGATDSDDIEGDEDSDFGAFLDTLEECGYSACWRVLDTQYVRVDTHPRAAPQRRQRLWVVGYLGDWRPPAAVLLEPEGLRGDPPPRRQAGERVAPTVEARTSAGGGAWGTDFLAGGGLVAGTLGAGRKSAGTATTQDAYQGLLIAAYGGNDTRGAIDVATACRAKGGTGHGDFESETFVVFDTTQVTHPENRSNPQPGEPCHPLTAHGHVPALAAFNIFPSSGQGADLEAAPTDVANAVSVVANERMTDRGTRIVGDVYVRRLTPLECERLQGLPDNFTLIPYRGRLAADGPRYRVIGNSMSNNVLRWIGQRIALFEEGRG